MKKLGDGNDFSGYYYYPILDSNIFKAGAEVVQSKSKGAKLFSPSSILHFGHF